MGFSLPSASFLFLCMCLLRSISISPYTFDTSSRRTSGTWLGALGPMGGVKHQQLKMQQGKEHLISGESLLNFYVKIQVIKKLFSVTPIRKTNKYIRIEKDCTGIHQLLTEVLPSVADYKKSSFFVFVLMFLQIFYHNHES